MTSNELCKPYLHWSAAQSKNASDPLNKSRMSPVASLATVAPAHTAIKTYVNAVITIAKIVPFGIDVDGSCSQILQFNMRLWRDFYACVRTRTYLQITGNIRTGQNTGRRWKEYRKYREKIVFHAVVRSIICFQVFRKYFRWKEQIKKGQIEIMWRMTDEWRSICWQTITAYRYIQQILWHVPIHFSDRPLCR